MNKPSNPIEAKKTDLLNRIKAILYKYEGNEGNIPSNNEYWNLLKEYNSLK